MNIRPEALVIYKHILEGMQENRNNLKMWEEMSTRSTKSTWEIADKVPKKVYNIPGKSVGSLSSWMYPNSRLPPPSCHVKNFYNSINQNFISNTYERGEWRSTICIIALFGLFIIYMLFREQMFQQSFSVNVRITLWNE